MSKSAIKKSPRRILRLASAGATVILIAAVSACSGGGDTGSGSGGSAAAPDPHNPEMTTVTGVMYQNPMAVQFIEAQPVAEDYGLTLEPEWMTDGAAGLSLVVSGEAQFVTVAPARAADANLSGIDVQIVAGNYLSAPGFATLEALPSSGVTSVKDLAGKTVGFPSTVGATANRLRAAIQEAGVDLDSVTFVQVPFGDVPASLQQGRIDAGSSQGAITAQLHDIGAETVFDFGSGTYENRAEGVWLATKDFIQKNPNTVAAFQCSVIQGGEPANDLANAQAVFKDVFAWDQSAIDTTQPVRSVTGPLEDFQVQADFDDLKSIDVEADDFDLTALVLPLPDNC